MDPDLSINSYTDPSEASRAVGLPRGTLAPDRVELPRAHHRAEDDRLVVRLGLLLPRALRAPLLVPLRELRELARLARVLDEAVLQELLRRRSLPAEIRLVRTPAFHRRLRTSFGSLMRQSPTKSLNALEKLPSSVGARALGMRKRTRMGWYSASGGSPLAISIAVMPSDQRSALAS